MGVVGVFAQFTKAFLAEKFYRDCKIGAIYEVRPPTLGLVLFCLLTPCLKHNQ